MSYDKASRYRVTRRRFVQGGALATAAAWLTACGLGGRAAEEATPTRAVAQRAAATPTGPSEATVPPTAMATSAPAPTDVPTAEPTLAPTDVPTSVPTLAPTPACADDDDETPAQTEGPYYTPSTPERTSFLEDGPGTPIVVTGRVLTTRCEPLAGALLDFWHADDGGAYDNVGYRFRGHLFTDNAGVYRLETIVPGLYPGRTRHFHVKVQGATTPLLTTQLYFPDEPGNARDGIFDPALLLALEETAEGLVGAFDFVLA